MGVPTATLVSTAFVTLARAQATALGVPDLPLVVVPHPMADRQAPEVHAIADRATPLVMRALTDPPGQLAREYREESVRTGG